MPLLPTGICAQPRTSYPCLRGQALFKQDPTPGDLLVELSSLAFPGQLCKLTMGNSSSTKQVPRTNLWDAPPKKQEMWLLKFMNRCLHCSWEQQACMGVNTTKLEKKGVLGPSRAQPPDCSEVMGRKLQAGGGAREHHCAGFAGQSWWPWCSHMPSRHTVTLSHWSRPVSNLHPHSDCLHH